MQTKSDLNPNQTFNYINDMLIELRALSEKENAAILAYLIEMAIIEAADLSSGIGIDKPAISAPQAKFG